METSGCASDDLCQAFSDVLLNIKDVDADDYDNPMLCSEYVKDIYLYLRQLEVCRKYALFVIMLVCVQQGELFCFSCRLSKLLGQNIWKERKSQETCVPFLLTGLCKSKLSLGYFRRPCT